MSENLKFLVDENLLGLLRWLRVMGVDSVTYLGVADAVLVSEARAQGRLILTKDRRLFSSLKSEPAYLVKSESPKSQLVEVLRHFHVGTEKALSRCFKCNTLIVSLPRGAVRGRVEEKTFTLYDKFYECPQCQHIFWEGSHYEKLSREIERIRRELNY